MTPLIFKARLRSTGQIAEVELVSNWADETWMFRMVRAIESGHDPDLTARSFYQYFQDDFITSGVWEFYDTPKEIQNEVLRICAAKNL
jgi:hypothetical protein